MSNTSLHWKNVIGYQCFVDSHAIGDGSIEEKTNLYESTVYDRPPQTLDWSDSCDDYCYGYAFYGGDLKGIIKSVHQYLADFGIDMLYLTPIFKAESNHKYDTLDYKTIDPQFGDLATFQQLIDSCHQNNIKVILDGVFNHTSYHHDWYLKATAGESPFNDYYKKNENGDFLNWNGVETLMLLNHQNADVRRYLYDAPDCVVKHWLELGADGWRLDVAERLGKEVIQKIKKCIRANFNDRILYGEVIESYGKEWLGDDLLDGAMNYVFLGNTVNFLQDKITGETLLFELKKMVDEYPKEQLYQSWNIISSHDTNRMIHEVNGNENLFKIAVTLQFTYPGIPMIYNGDELGVLPGEKDKDNRQGLDWQRIDILQLKAREPWKTMQPMDWNRVNEYSSFHFFYKHLIWLRKNYPVFVEGEFLPVYCDNNIIAFFRHLDEHVALVMVNKGEAKEITLKIPEFIYKHKPVLKGVHGPINNVQLTEAFVRLNLETECSIILVNG